MPQTLQRQPHRFFPRGKAEKLHARRDDLPALALAAIVFRLELASPKSTLDKDLSALFQVLIAGFRELSERHDVGPFDVFLLLSLLAGEDSSVAIEKPTASCPVGRYRISGSLPRFPITIARSSSRLLVRVHQ